MNYEKNLSVDIPPATRIIIIDGIKASLDALNGVAIVTLKPEQRQTIPNVEANRYSYVKKAINDFGPQFPNLESRAVKTANAQTALDSYDFLTEVLGMLLEFNDRAGDLRHNLGNTTYNYTLDMYHEAQRYVGDLPGADTIVKELQPLFDEQGPQNPPPPAP